MTPPLIRLLFRPSEFFRERALRPPERRAPAVFITMWLVLVTLADVLASPSDAEVGLGAQLMMAVLVGVLLSPVAFLVGYWLPLRFVAGSFVRPWESGGYSLAPVAFGGVLMVAMALAAPGVYATGSIWLFIFFGFWNLVVLYRALLVYIPEDRARFAIGACMLMALFLNGATRAMASLPASAR